MLKLAEAFKQKSYSHTASILNILSDPMHLLSDPLIGSQMCRYLKTLKKDAFLIDLGNQTSETLHSHLQTDVIAVAKKVQMFPKSFTVKPPFKALESFSTAAQVLGYLGYKQPVKHLIS